MFHHINIEIAFFIWKISESRESEISA